MFWRLVKIVGDGDCFFSALAAYDFWTTRDADAEMLGAHKAILWAALNCGTLRHQGISERAAQLRRALAAYLWDHLLGGVRFTWTAKDAVGSPMPDAAAGDRNLQLKEILGTPDLSLAMMRLLEKTTTEARELVVREAFAGTLRAGDQRRILEYYLHWLSFPAKEIEKNGHKETFQSAGVPVPTHCVWGGGWLDRAVTGNVRFLGVGASPAKLGGAYLEHNFYHFDLKIWVTDPECANYRDEFEWPQPVVLVRREVEGATAALRQSISLSLSRDQKNTAADDPLRVGAGVWNVNHLGAVAATKNVPELGAEATIKRKYKNRLKVDAFKELLEANTDWLGLMGLNEVNFDGMKVLCSTELPKGWAVASGPFLKSTTGKVRGRSQHEFYPLFYQSDRFECHGAWIMGSRRTDTPMKVLSAANLNQFRQTFLARGRASKRNGLEWMKTEHIKNGNDTKTYIYGTTRMSRQRHRPVVFYQLTDKQTGKRIHFAILHTTPYGDEFNRQEVYEQLSCLFEYAQQQVEVRWIIGGDYYLFGESIAIGSGYVKEFLRALPDGQLDLLEADVERDIRKALETCETYDTPISCYGTMEGDQASGKKNAKQAVQVTRAHIRELRGAIWRDQTRRRRHKARWREVAATMSRLRFKGQGEMYDTDIEAFKDKRYDLLLDADFDLLFWDESFQVERAALEKALTADRLKDNAKADEKDRIIDRIFAKDKALSTFLARCVFCYQDAWEWMVDCRAAERAYLASQNSQDVPGDLDSEMGEDGDDVPEPVGVEKDEYIAPLNFYRRNREWASSADQRLRNWVGRTFRSQLKDKLHVLHTIWATNIHGAAKIERDGEPDFSAHRIADFLICSRHFRSFDIGIFQAVSGDRSGLLRIDGEFDEKTGKQSFPATVYWRKLSDHFPVGATFSEWRRDPWIEVPFAGSEDAEKVGNRLVMVLLDFNEGLPKPLRFGESGPATNDERLETTKKYLSGWLDEANWKQAGDAIRAIDLKTDPTVARDVLSRIASAMVHADVVKLAEVKRKLQTSDVWPLEADGVIEEPILVEAEKPQVPSASKQEVEAPRREPDMDVDTDAPQKRRKRRVSRSPEPAAKRFKREPTEPMDDPPAPAFQFPQISANQLEARQMEVDRTASSAFSSPDIEMGNTENSGMQ